MPVRFLDLQLLPSEPRQLIELGTAPGVGLAPLGRDETAFLETIERREQRARLNVERPSGQLADAPRDAEAMQRAGHHAAEDQQIKRPAHQIGAYVSHGRLL